MIWRRMQGALIGICLASVTLPWPTERVDVSPLFEQPVPQTRPERPPHPIEIYRPPGSK